MFWNDADECVEKCGRLLSDEEWRREVARNGQLRAMRNGTTNETVMNRIISKVFDSVRLEALVGKLRQKPALRQKCSKGNASSEPNLGRFLACNYVVSHPIQYQAPLLRRLAQERDIDLTVFYCSDCSVQELCGWRVWRHSGQVGCSFIGRLSI